ncbi:uncharacterized protein PV09_05606 [Verruconis gallopava]|uniref:Pre-mRNA-splicing factor n=1 Tax=Verruconis gallopava TaxID=253628 RepID=A0A0D1XLW2_9PEZI|nr:uncharacterized protein PV09_05606 [Verruconis gallopava]KIW03401.1 hypothetical protein PV09_05606 [Verruconis gallopava]
MAEGSKFSLRLGSKALEPPSHRPHEHVDHSNGTKRPHAALDDSDNEEDTGSKHQSITHFDKSVGGAFHSESTITAKKPLVIPVAESSSGRKRQKSSLPSQSAEAAEAAEAEAKANAAPVSFGLNLMKAKEHKDDASTIIVQANDTPTRSEPAETTVDEEALQALLGQKKNSNTIIPTLIDEEVFQRDYENAPDAPTESDYDAVPIDEFGAAMLRGMGWKDGEAIGRNKGQAPPKQRTLERRPELLGVGAKPANALGIELGEWGKQAKKHERKLDQAYAPVMLKNKMTGEMITEEEFQRRLKEQEMSFADDEEEEDRKGKEAEKERKRKREKDLDRDPNDRQHRSSRRDRSSSYDNHRRRRYEDDNVSDRSKYERRRDRERRRRDISMSRERDHSRKERNYWDREYEPRHRNDDRYYEKEKSIHDRSTRNIRW